jgi:hypothetical protein
MLGVILFSTPLWQRSADPEMRPLVAEKASQA